MATAVFLLVLIALSYQQSFDDMLEAVNKKFMSPFKPQEIEEKTITRDRMKEVLVGFLKQLPDKVIKKDSEEFKKTVKMAEDYCTQVLTYINSLDTIVRKLYTGEMFEEIISKKEITRLESYNQMESIIEEQLREYHAIHY